VTKLRPWYGGGLGRHAPRRGGRGRTGGPLGAWHTRSATKGEPTCGTRTSRHREAWEPGKGAQPREAQDLEGTGDPDAEAAWAGAVRTGDVASWRQTVSQCSCLNVKISQNLNRTPLNFEYESCRAHLGEYFS
jgi:hypothetical protein